MNQKNINDNQDELMSRVESVKQELASNPSVLAVGLGYKETNNEFTEEISFRVFVAEKKDLSELSEEELIPPQVGDIKTDVLTPYHVSDRPAVCGDERETLSTHRPLQAGIAISTDSISYGTLGWFGTVDADDRRILLTNKHVLYDVTNETITDKKKTAQPQLGRKTDCCCCECGSDNVIGETIIGIRTMSPLSATSVDCAIAEIDDEHASDISMVITNDATDQVLTVSGTAAAVVGQNVRKIGARSGFTRGTVVHIGDAAVAGTDPLGAPITIRTGQVLIIPTAAETYQVDDSGTCKFAFSNNGDSGSVILNDADEIVALLYGGDETSNSVDVTFANNINNVLTALSNGGFMITLSTSPAGAGDGRSRLHNYGYAFRKSEPTHLEAIRDANKESLAYKLTEMHHQEILDLINHTRAVTVAWHRNQGPAFAAAVARAARVESYEVPAEIEGIDRKTLLKKMVAILPKYASEALASDISTYAPELIELVATHTGLDELADELKATGFIDVTPAEVTERVH